MFTAIIYFHIDIINNLAINESYFEHKKLIIYDLIQEICESELEYNA